ncbi:MAG: AMP-binding protein, partial [Bacteroidales bacterium]
MDISFNKMIEDSFKKNWDCPALSDYKGITLYYRDVARRIEKLHIIFSICGIQKGKKIALCARNQANWGVVFLACITYGAVPVPILHEFKPGNIEFIVNHSEAKALFVGSRVAEEITASNMPNVENIINLDEFKILYAKDPKVPDTREHLNELFGKKYPKAFVKESLNYYKEGSPNELALINYTSGTSGFSKGVMIPYRALISNVLFAVQVMPQVNNTSSVVSMLPTAHMYGMMFEFLFEMCVGAHVFFLTRVPSPSIIVKALEEIKPILIIAVPLIIEKIYKSRLQPFLKKPGMRFLLGLPIVDKKIGDKINETLSNTFGGNFLEVIVGGAAFNKEADSFFHKIGFRYTVGYGMTECAPIIAYSPWDKLKLYSCGKAAPRMQIKVDSAIPATIPGEILVKGDNVMLGYYRNDEATKESFTSDGWFRTGDLGLMDEDGYLYIKGRSKTMILGPSGQN